MDQQKAKSIFLHAVEHIAPDEWPNYLSVACSDNPNLRHQVEELLAAHQDDGDLADQARQACAEALPTLDQPITEKPGTQIGPYKLLQQLGEGGMGVVYMAEQKEPVKRRVALKIIKPGMDTRQVIARFEAERQALAMMDHPNIAKVLDAGQTESGRPYFVMELVNGLPVTKYCDEQHLTPKERLELFVPICQAVQHAHQKGIIHRDLKPSNILVAMYDNKAVPKIIDFGVAKATSQTLTDKTMFTQLGQVVGTLEYMSPEQAQRNQLDIDTRSDIYSLGVVLYELLTGETPFDRTRLRSAAFDEMLRIIREEEPSKPSTKVSSSLSLASIAANRRIEPAKLGSMIRGELDWIVLKAMEKDRRRRYETASKFAEDVQHYLNDEAVIACPPSRAYKFRKFVRRNKVALGITAAVSATMILGSIGTSWQAYRAWQAEEVAENRLKTVESQRKALSEQKKRADQAAEKANSEAAISRAVNEFLNDDLLGMADAGSQILGGIEPEPDVELRTVLDRAASRIDRRFDEQPLVEAAIRETIGKTYESLGDGESSEKHLRRALELRSQYLGAMHRSVLRTMSLLANALILQGKFSQAELFYRQTLDRYEQTFGSEDEDFLLVTVGLAHALTKQRKYEEAEQLCLKALEASRPLAADPLIAAYLESSLAIAVYDQKRFVEAEMYFRRVHPIYCQTLSRKHPRSLLCLSNLANALREQGEYAESERRHREALELSQQVLDSGHYVVLNCARNLAETFVKQQRLADAEAVLRGALSSSNGATASEELHMIVRELCDILAGQGRLSEAEQELDTFLDSIQNPNHTDDTHLAGTMLLAATVYAMDCKYAQAIEHGQIAHEIFDNALGTNAQQTLLARGLLAVCNSNYAFELATKAEWEHRDSGQMVSLAQAGVRLWPQPNPIGGTAGQPHNILAVALYRNGQWQEAANAFEKASRCDDQESPQFGFFRAMAHWQKGDRDLALEHYVRTVRWIEQVEDPGEQVAFRAEAVSVIPRDAIDEYLTQKEKEAELGMNE